MGVEEEDEEGDEDEEEWEVEVTRRSARSRKVINYAEFGGSGEDDEDEDFVDEEDEEVGGVVKELPGDDDDDDEDEEMDGREEAAKVKKRKRESQVAGQMEQAKRVKEEADDVVMQRDELRAASVSCSSSVTSSSSRSVSPSPAAAAASRPAAPHPAAPRPPLQLFSEPPAVLELKEVNPHATLDDLEFAPTFRPTEEEFDDPMAFIASVREVGEKYGVIRVIPPASWVESNGDAHLEFHEGTGGRASSSKTVLPLKKQVLKFDYTERADAGQITNMKSAPVSLQQYLRMDRRRVQRFQREFPELDMSNHDHMEQAYWRSLEAMSGRNEDSSAKKRKKRKGKLSSFESSRSYTVLAHYASDFAGTAFGKPLSSDGKTHSDWDLRRLPLHPKSVLSLVTQDIPGVTRPMLYVGMACATFAWHVEDNWLYSVSYNHTGEPKTWYGVPGKFAPMLEMVADELYSRRRDDEALDNTPVSQFLARKASMFSPALLLRHGIPVYKARQVAGSFMVTFPRAYHSGFSHAYQCAEAVNFAMEDWIPYGREATALYRSIGQFPVVAHEELVIRAAERVLHDHDNDGVATRYPFLHIVDDLTLLGREHAAFHIKLNSFMRNVEVRVMGDEARKHCTTFYCSSCSYACFSCVFLCPKCSPDMALCHRHDRKTVHEFCQCERPLCLMRFPAKMLIKMAYRLIHVRAVVAKRHE